jgi:soluble lytic murein transglycosylase-like protein
MKLHRVVQSLVFSFLLVTATSAQSRHEPSLSERAQQLEPFIIASARTYGVDARILRALCFIESRYRIDVVSPKGARGPMQFMPETAARYGLHDPHDPQSAIDAAARYLRDLLKRFNGRVDLALAAYNAGEGAVTSFMTGKPLLLRSGKLVNARGLVTGGIPPYFETQQYVRSAIALLNDRPFVTSKPTLNALRVGLRSRPIALKNFTLDVFPYLDTIPIKATGSGPSSFIEIQ